MNAFIGPLWIFGNFRGDGHELLDAYGAQTPRVPGVYFDITLNTGTSEEEPEGAPIPIHRLAPEALNRLRAEGISFAAWWDRQAKSDKRRGSYVAVFARGDWTRAQLIEALRNRAPWAIRVEVQP